MSAEAIRVVQHGQVMLLFSVPAERLIDISYFNPREIDREHGIQRPFRESRAREIAEYIDSDDSVLPNNIIINMELAAIGLALGDVYNEKARQLDIDKISRHASMRRGILRGKAAFVIDGQHRLRAFELSSHKEFPLIVSAMVDLSLAQVAEVFVEINYYQKSVNKSLVFDLLGISRRLFPQYYMLHNLAAQLNDDVASPFYGSIKMLGVGSGYISQASLITAIEKYRILDALRNLKVRPDAPVLYDVLWNYFTAVRKVFGDYWNADSRLCRTVGIRALVMLLRDVLTRFGEQGKELSSQNVAAVLKKIDMCDILKHTAGVGGEAGVKVFYEKMKLQAGV
jgi:DGQHR domain-containing protein